MTGRRASRGSDAAALARKKEDERRTTERARGVTRNAARDGSAETASADLADRLHSAAIHLLRQLRREDSASGLTAPRLSVLSVLVFGGDRTLTQLAEAEQVRPPTMTRLVQALEADGLVRREGDPADARVVRIHATAKGRRLLQEGRTRRVAALASTLDELSAGDRRKLQSAVEILERVAGRSATQPPRLTRSK